MQADNRPAAPRDRRQAASAGGLSEGELDAGGLGPVTSGDAANVGGSRTDPDTARGPAGGATLAGNVGDAGADAGEGSIDATDDTTVTGDPDRSPAATARTTDRREPAGMDPSQTGYGQRGASGALGPEDVDPASGAPEPDYGPSVTGPDAEQGPKGDPAARGADTGLGRAQDYPTEAGTTNVRGPADERRERESPAGR